MLYELILINEIEQRAKIIFLSVSSTQMIYFANYYNVVCMRAHFWKNAHYKQKPVGRCIPS